MINCKYYRSILFCRDAPPEEGIIALIILQAIYSGNDDFENPEDESEGLIRGSKKLLSVCRIMIIETISMK